MKITLALLFGCCFASSVLAQSTSVAGVKNVWVEVVAGGAEVRAIVEAGAACPVAKVDGRKLPLMKREESAKNEGGFLPLCEAALPAKAKRLVVADQSLTLPKQDVKRILVIGDTGCRQIGVEKQDCAKDWPFHAIADAAARKHPDLVIHVGDYYYRELCAEGVKHCENWGNWNADFFAPAQKLLTTAPWVFARGNHETCSRAAEGWFRYLDAADTPVRCPKAKATEFLVQLQNLNIAVLDTGDMPDIWPADRKLQAFAESLKALNPPAGQQEWIVTHKPPFVDGFMNGAPKNEVEHDPSIPDLDLILAGHLHLFGSVTYPTGRPAQLIVGDSGTRLMVNATKAESKTLVEGEKQIDGQKADFAFKGQFGYFLMERATASSKHWKGTLHAIDDSLIATCDLEGKSIHCVSSSSQQ